MSQNYIETPRLLLKELDDSHLHDFFKLESDPHVQKYITALSNNTISTPGQAQDVLDSIRQQYVTYGIARLAVLEKNSGQFIGLAGVKWHPDSINNHKFFYDLGYRLLPEYWGKGYATEAAQAACDHCISIFQPLKIYAFVHIDNHNSRHILTKLGFRYIEDFNFNGALMCWYQRITKQGT